LRGPIINKNGGRRYGLPLFLFAFIRATADNGVKIASNGFYLFWGYSHIGESENERQRAKNQAREGNGNEGAQRNTAHDSIFASFSAFSRLGGTLGRVERLKRITSDF
jgi:hypothetical protein